MKKLNSNHLKLIAIIAMTIDHLADFLYPAMPNIAISNIMHIVGRLTAPIMFFFICEGYFYTKNIKKYITRLFIFAFISHFAYCFAFGINFIPFTSGSIFNQTSIMWSLAWAVVALHILHGENNLKNYQKWLLIILINIITFPADFSSIVVMAILFMYDRRNNFKGQMISMMSWLLLYSLISYLFVNKTYGVIELSSVLVIPLLYNYNKERGKAKWLKWFFYIYYPLHLFIIGLLRLNTYGNIPLLFN